MLPATYVEGFHDLEAVKTMEYRKLGKTELMVSKLSFGGGPLGCHYGLVFFSFFFLNCYINKIVYNFF